MNSERFSHSQIKPLIAIVLALIAVGAAVGTPAPNAFADQLTSQPLSAQHEDISGKTVNGLTYDIYFDGTNDAHSVFITKYSGNATKLIIPTSITINNETISFSDSEIFISEKAFEGNPTLIEVGIPSQVKSLGTEAFANCSALEKVVIEGSETDAFAPQYFQEDVFKGCGNLKSYYFGKEFTENSVKPEDLKNASVGLESSSSGVVYPNVTISTVKGSPIDVYISTTNNDSDVKIAVKYDSDPYKTGIASITPSDSGSRSSTSSKSSGSSSTSKPSSSSHSTSRSASSSSSTEKAAEPFGTGATEDQLNKAATKYSKESDPKGTTFQLLRANAKTVTNKTVTLKWSKVKGAKKYVVYGNKCGVKNKMVKLITTKKVGNTFKKVNKKAVKKGTYYKFFVAALDKNNKVISSSKFVHAATKGGKVGNDKKVITAAKKNKVTVKVKKTFKLKAKEVAQSKKLKVNHHRRVAYESSNPKVAKVTKKGVIKGLKKGTCNVYAYAQNGVFAKVKVTVK